MKIKNTAKIAAITMAVGVAAGMTGEWYMLKSGKAKSIKRKANKTLRAMENMVEDFKEIME